jgi:3-deoxy-D-manno-octulosonate 8-phosphate phosphatase (KDO 8-P phosphatase)
VDVVKKRTITKGAWARIRLFAMDVDGVLTDGTVSISSDGTETKRFSIIDGLGLILVRGSGVDVAWISGRKSDATALRAAELKIPHVIQGEHDKLTALTSLAAHLNIPLTDCAYMGDDFIDAPAIAAAGIGISVPTALPAALAAADYVTRRPAGMGAVREVCDLILRARPPLSGGILIAGMCLPFTK